jgi:peptide/nickel transport system permease protein
VFGISLLVFAMVALLPGDPATAILGPYATPERVARLNTELGLGDSLGQRYLTWMSSLLHGDFGRSYSMQRPVLDVLLERMPATLALSSCALGLGALLGLLLGSVAAARRGQLADRALSVVTVLGISTPSFWLAMLLMLVFSVHLGWFPVSGMASAYGEGAGGLLDRAHHVVLPALALALVVAGVIGRLMRTAMLETFSQNFVRMARAKGVPEGAVIYGHAFQLALTRVVPVIGLQAGFVLGGAVYIEAVFQWPGLGKVLVDAIVERDFLLTQGAVLVVACCYVLVNLATDLVQRALDPRLVK